MKKCLSIILGCFAAGIVLFNTTACHRDPVYIGELPIDPIDTSGGGGTVIVHPCSPDSVYFEQQLLPIIQSNCAVSGCHDAAAPIMAVKADLGDQHLGYDNLTHAFSS